MIDVRGWKTWGIPFLIFGVNPLAICFLASLAETVLNVHHIGGQSIRHAIFGEVFTPVFSDPYIASLAWAISFVTVSFLVAWFMYQRRIFIRI